MKKLILLLAIALLPWSYAHAEEKIIDTIGLYILGDSGVDNVDGSKAGARKDALRRASEQAGVFVESMSTVKDHMLTADQVNTVSGAVMQVLSERYEMIPLEGGIEFRCFIKVKIDTDSVNEYIKNHKELTATKARNSELEHAVHTIQKRQAAPFLFCRDLTAEKLYHQAFALELQDRDRAIYLYQNAIKLYPGFIDAYARLASLYKDTDQRLAMTYADKGIELLKRGRSLLEIDHLVNSWYVVNGTVMGDYNPNIQHLYAVKSYLEGVPQKTETYDQTDSEGYVKKITKVWTKSDW